MCSNITCALYFNLIHIFSDDEPMTVFSLDEKKGKHRKSRNKWTDMVLKENKI